MRVRFLGQGLQNEGETTGKNLIESFQNQNFNTFTAFVAFAGVSGIRLLNQSIQEAKKHIKQWNLFIGVDLKGTSKEALEFLL